MLHVQASALSFPTRPTHLLGEYEADSFSLFLATISNRFRMIQPNVSRVGELKRVYYSVKRWVISASYGERRRDNSLGSPERSTL